MSMGLKRILNKTEEKTNNRLKEICDINGAIVYAKVRLADILPIENSGISNELYRYSLQSHFDFTIADNQHKPLFSVEFDGPSHFQCKQIERDKMKNELCERFGLPLLRIDAGCLERKYRNFDILGWFIETWYFSEAFYDAQNKGIVPPDEPFNPFAVINLPGHKEQFPLWLALPIQLQIQELHKSKLISDFAPSHVIGVDTNGNYHGISWIRIDHENGVMSSVSMKSQLFPVFESDILSELLIYRIFEELSKTMSGEIPAAKIQMIDMKIESFRIEYKKIDEAIIVIPNEEITE